MKKLVIIALMAACVAGCSTVDNAATEGKNAFQTGMRTSEKARTFDGIKQENDNTGEEF